MSEDEFKTLTTKQGLHSFVVVLSARGVLDATSQDLWVRSVVAAFAAFAAGGVAFAWITLTKSSELRMRLLRASEQNNHLRELNLAAAGLAHETRNPLNIVRGLAQMISRQEDVAPDVRRKSSEIVNEVDRVTAQLNLFMNYSKPPDLRPAILNLDSVLGDVLRALGGDAEEKRVSLSLVQGGLRIEADDRMLRQAVFNLVLNALQAVEPGESVQVSSGTGPQGLAFIEVRDTGPGVPAEDRQEIFKPYFTRRPGGTGLGLAVVHQIVLAHGWDIECLAHEPRGAVLRISHIRKALPAS